MTTLSILKVYIPLNTKQPLLYRP